VERGAHGIALFGSVEDDPRDAVLLLIDLHARVLLPQHWCSLLQYEFLFAGTVQPRPDDSQLSKRVADNVVLIEVLIKVLNKSLAVIPFEPNARQPL
jgi:hypothetical protein